ncbi:MAG: hypothetical protein HY852_15040 [Bradyrhizobium sp.]|uniref:hypothetical protein n=1 Tax=Bradyrhizobium sp. TaxID=376 RepID=UPI0025BDFCC1|nr:hypothetical protein [Bradyrhizobium sp.]MBI5263124.1 hypothetical protein [Bradyrhizobium sp.]
MKKTHLVFATLLTAGLVAAPFAAEAKSKTKQKSSTSSTMTTGANVKSTKGMSKNPSSQGNVGSGTTQGGSTRSYGY